MIGSAGALAYQSGTIGFDISYPQCGRTYPTNLRTILFTRHRADIDVVPHMSPLSEKL